MKTPAGNIWPVASILGIYWIVLVGIVVRSVAQNDGHLVYPLDDTYIHMAIAKNAALHHVWGVTRYDFTSSTSSPLWTLLLALTYASVGVNALAPLLWNAIAATLIIVSTDRLLKDRCASSSVVFVALLVLVFGGAVPTMTFVGMEHTLHGLFTIWFTFQAAALLAADRAPTIGGLAALGVLSFATVGLRYEGMFTVGVAALLFASTRRLAGAVITLGAGALLPVGYGAWSVSRGWLVLPNSVLLKSHLPERTFSGVAQFVLSTRVFEQLASNPAILAIVFVAILLFVRLAVAGLTGGRDGFLLAILVGAIFGHLQMAQTGWFFRYEAYLLITGIVILESIGLSWLASIRGAGAIRHYIVGLALLAIVGVPLAVRGLRALRSVPQATTNIYHQPYQMALFVRRFYPEATVALNDIGAVDYFAEVRLIDIVGLGSIEPARLKLRGAYQSTTIAAIAADKRVEIAIVSPGVLGEFGGVPAGWTDVGEWRVQNNIVLGGNTVAFYAVDPVAKTRLVENLRRFSSELPLAVAQSGEYLLAANSH